MHVKIKQWEATGEYISYGPFQHKMFVKQVGNPNASAEKTLLLLHGFPESSYSYSAVLDGLSKVFDRIILFDMIGYGLSDKPIENYSYSLLEQAETTFAVWKHFGVTGGHMLSHDMGDSVATEIVARHENGLMPSWLVYGLQSATFTNGSMVLGMAKLRITQKLLLSKYGKIVGKRSSFKVFQQQVKSAHGNDTLSDEAVEMLWENNILQAGNEKAYLTIQYLNDRKKFEQTRWLPALGQTKLPIHLCWGNADAVARVEMAHYLKQHVCKNATLTIMDGVGHFCQLGSPEVWLKHISAYYQRN
jgi:pimeloyl-ACP methyl ester carboxylesterase